MFRVDGSFTTLSASLNASVTDLLTLLGKKSFLQDDLTNYVIILRKQDLARILNRQERPLLIQKKLLEQVGYTEEDHLDEIGREDHSYLCRFTFLPSRVSGHSLVSILHRYPTLFKLTWNYPRTRILALTRRTNSIMLISLDEIS